MIKKVSFGESAFRGGNLIHGGVSTFKGKNPNVPNENTSKISQFGDSFVRNAIDRAPFLLLLTGGFTAVDNLIRKVPLKDAVKNNFKWVFAPVLLITSVASAIIENKK